MSQEFDAIYERGVFRPLEGISLPEQTKVHLQIQGEAASASLADEVSAQKTALRELLRGINSRPLPAAGQSVSARDHDRILYDRQQ